jgi:hypothetical protein
MTTKRGYAGTGKAQHNSAEWIEAPDAVPTRPSDQSEDREGFTVKRTVTPCSMLAAKHNGLAGGDRGTWGSPIPDELPGSESC